MRSIFILLMVILSLLIGCTDSEKEHSSKDYLLRNSKYIDELGNTIPILEIFHERMPKPKGGDWLATHEENGQTFDEYLDAEPVVIDEQHNIIYIQPLGEFTKTQMQIVSKVAENMSIFFNAEVKINKTLDLSIIPENKQREHFGNHQLYTPYILDEVLLPRKPKDTAVFLCFTAIDLYPDEEWNFVFGQANLRTRCGVWSINRFGNPDESEDTCKLVLRRAITTATHETGHMFTIKHCIKWKCNMNGSNNLEEKDSRNFWLCPECNAKVCWATGADPITRFEKLAVYCQKESFKNESKQFTMFAEALKKIKSQN